MKTTNDILKTIRVFDDKFKLSNFSTRLYSKGLKNENQLKNSLDSDIEEISKLQNKLYAEDRQSLLISVCPFSQEKNRKLTKYWILAD